ncbi:hypothetical protein HMPREF9709_01192 [Helcococcus kunzii ATCC 51366]|uniref:Uncharacterized protein n=1 Tax=Helcococcus kunzii ATCC 51366 TaxID=883114 RepID=H3NPD1_9FIRM|nr:hypothetical protein [Helcococcus kunzii]EHR33444.1 hypothetical protein HMPREF9709_01192 [Helcococcus kunzii ATCC 51366]
MYIDYSFYSGEYGGTVTEQKFNKLNIQAQSKVDYFTFGRIKYLETIPDTVKFAVCEVIDTLDEYYIELSNKSSASRRIASETIGSHSVSFKYGDEITTSKNKDKTIDDRVYEVVSTYLMNEQNLMYRGVECHDYGI